MVDQELGWKQFLECFGLNDIVKKIGTYFEYFQWNIVPVQKSSSQAHKHDLPAYPYPLLFIIIPLFLFALNTNHDCL